LNFPFCGRQSIVSVCGRSWKNALSAYQPGIRKLATIQLAQLDKAINGNWIKGICARLQGHSFMLASVMVFTAPQAPS